MLTPIKCTLFLGANERASERAIERTESNRTQKKEIECLGCRKEEEYNMFYVHMKLKQNKRMRERKKCSNRNNKNDERASKRSKDIDTRHTLHFFLSRMNVVVAAATAHIE